MEEVEGNAPDTISLARGVEGTMEEFEEMQGCDADSWEAASLECEGKSEEKSELAEERVTVTEGMGLEMRGVRFD